MQIQFIEIGGVIFFLQPEVALTNYLDERYILPLKLKHKMSGCIQTRKGSQDFVILRNKIKTARKQNWGMLSELQTYPYELI